MTQRGRIGPMITPESGKRQSQEANAGGSGRRSSASGRVSLATGFDAQQLRVPAAGWLQQQVPASMRS